ncbi:MAG: PKD domain-containing protein, partial [Bacteroidales bacterium]|nr:PKD domain-containing protein [Bacteroidales bacterium]
MKRIPIISRMIMVLSVFIFAGNMQAQTIRTNANGFPVRIHQKDAYTGSRTKSDNQLLREQRYMFLSEKYSGEGLSGDVISGNGVLVADLSPVHQSGPEIYAIIDNMEIPVEYTTYLPPNLHDYASVFVCLGMFPENYILSDPEGEMLKAYLLSGGNVMMEGGDTWYWDYPTPVHPLFNIQGIEEAFWYDIRDVAGQPGTLTDGMLFAYQNGNYMWGPDFDEIEAITPALDIFFHSDPPFGCGVSFDAGAYRTVGLAFEIGGLAELYGTTKDQLVASILSFFGPGFTPGLIEDFETGDFSKFPWLLGGLSPWTIDTSAPYEGMYAARSGQTTGNGFSLLSLMLQVDQPGEISFWLKVSSEPMYDFLRFSIDNVLISEWSGETGWIQAAFPVEPGNHLFTWSYEKDFSVNLGEDCARLDFIIFPGSSPNLVADFMAEPTMVCEGEPVHFFDQSVGNITSWQWEFPGGIPEISAEQYPMVHYPTFGVYDVTLTVSDGYNVATLTKPGYITVEHCTYSDILIADLDNNHNSGPVIMNAIGNLGLSAEYKVTIPNDLASYSSVFLCLGTWPENHILSNAEADMLVNFVTSGGNLYMEGADTWFFDPQTPLHPLFHIMPVSDGTYDPELELIMGQPGTFTESMSFLYDGDDIWVDHIQPMGPSFLVLENTGFSPFGCAVALDAGMYKTVGASAEIGGMAFGSTPVEELVHHILEFFGSGGGGGDNIEDFETGDFSKFPWQFGGSGGWHIETADPFEGVYCAASDSIGGNPAGGIEFADLFIQMTVEQPDVISFFRRISSEPNYDKLIFLIDEIEIAQWSGEIPWMPEEFPVEPGVHVFTWRYEKDFSVSMGQDRAWVDYITLPGGGTPPPPPPVDEDFETGDFSKFPWEFAGNEPWIIDSTMPFAGQFCARSGMIPDNSSSSLMISLNILQPGEISFFRKVSSENNYDQLIFSIDNQQVATWSGEMEWGFEAFPVPPGVHTFRWDYLKDNVIAWGADAAFIDDITFPPFENPCPPVVAMFEYAVNPVNAFVYSFTSTSTGPVSEWFWDFGDGTTSTLENPEHQFPGPGIFHVCLTVISSCNGQVDTWCEEIVVDDPCPPCIAHFSYIIDPADPFTVWFNDESQGNLATWFWDFGDGTTSPDQFPVH